MVRTQGGYTTTHRRVKEFGYSCHQRHLTWAKEKNWTVAQWSKVLFSDESKFCISFGNQGPRVWRKGGEAHSPSCLKSSVKFPQSVMIWGAMSSAGVGPLCFLKTNVTAPVYQEILGHFMLPSADQLFKDADFIFQKDLAPAHTAKCTKSWLNDHGVGVLDWPANSPDVNPIENLWGIVKRKMRNKRPKNADELNATVKETWAVQRPGSSRGLPAGAGIQTHNLGLPRVSRPTFYPLGHNCPIGVFFYKKNNLKKQRLKLLQSVCIEFI